MTAVTRFAPSPTGLLHLGHAYAALFAAEAGDRFLLRIEDIDRTRCRPAFEAAIAEDLAWLGLDWETPVRRQSDHFADYRAALRRLEGMGVTYPCFCTRKDIAASIDAPHGPDGPVYPGTCRRLDAALRAERIARGDTYAVRLDMAKAIGRAGPLTMVEGGKRIPADPAIFGDVVLARKDTPASYHLAVTTDDALQGITLVTRGEDLLPASFVHRLLQTLLGLPEPAYRHHRILTDAHGKRLAKRDNAEPLRAMRERGVLPDDLRRRLGFDG
ncbi:MAG: tRNA glutamyl-Q(34) synthetase GluQRS [Alphaproteobacteria bacterium]|nr:tRNA glutamyl-Q(34) synthetase GluQRS [Alphaproteobacteria bacterium]